MSARPRRSVPLSVSDRAPVLWSASRLYACEARGADALRAQDSHTARVLFERLLMGPLVAHRTVLLVTHHVELVLPGTHYLVQMREGRIHQQGTVRELTARGLLDYIAQDEGVVVAAAVAAAADGAPAADGPKAARKLVEDEVRAEGTVRWAVYRAYMRAS